MEHLTVSRKLVGPASLTNILKTVDNIFANRCSRRLERPIRLQKFLIRRGLISKDKTDISCNLSAALQNHNHARTALDRSKTPSCRNREYYTLTYTTVNTC